MKEVKTMKVWTNGKGICKYNGQDKYKAVTRKESEGYKVMIAKLYEVEDNTNEWYQNPNQRNARKGLTR